MELIRILISRCAALFRRRRLDEDLDAELSSHVELAVEENMRRGMSPQEARTTALRSFGGIDADQGSVSNAARASIS